MNISAEPIKYPSSLHGEQQKSTKYSTLYGLNLYLQVIFAKCAKIYYLFAEPITMQSSLNFSQKCDLIHNLLNSSSLTPTRAAELTGQAILVNTFNNRRVTLFALILCSLLLLRSLKSADCFRHRRNHSFRTANFLARNTSQFRSLTNHSISNDHLFATDGCGPRIPANWPNYKCHHLYYLSLLIIHRFILSQMFTQSVNSFTTHNTRQLAGHKPKTDRHSYQATFPSNLR